MSTRNCTCLASFQDFEETINFTLATTIVGFLPYIILIGSYYFTRKTDSRQSHYPIHTNLVILSAVNTFGCFILAIMLLLLESSRDIMEKSDEIPSLYKILTCLLINLSSIITTIIYYILFLSASQRLFLLTNAKLGTRVMTGRRLTFNIVILYFVGIISAFNKILADNKTPWLEIITIILTLLMYLFSTFMVHHIERRSIAIIHVTVLAQTTPIAVFLAFLTVVKFYVTTSGQYFISTWTFQAIMACSLSLFIPFFLVMGSSTKRRIMVTLTTCQWEERSLRGEVYTAERTPASMSHVVSMIPNRF